MRHRLQRNVSQSHFFAFQKEFIAMVYDLKIVKSFQRMLVAESQRNSKLSMENDAALSRIVDMKLQCQTLKRKLEEADMYSCIGSIAIAEEP